MNLKQAPHLASYYYFQLKLDCAKYIIALDPQQAIHEHGHSSVVQTAMYYLATTNEQAAINAHLEMLELALKHGSTANLRSYIQYNCANRPLIDQLLAKYNK